MRNRMHDVNALSHFSANAHAAAGAAEDSYLKSASIRRRRPTKRIACECGIAYASGVDTTSAILQRLRARGLTQLEIARRSGIPQPRLSKWENGAVPVGADDALKLAALDRAMSEALATSDPLRGHANREAA